MSEPLPEPLDDAAFDQALIAAGFRLAAAEGWRNLRIAAAAQAAGLSLSRARLRFPSRAAFLVRFGRLADAAALAEIAAEGTVRDRLFGMLMRRLDVFQAHREGVQALLRSLPCRPETTLLLGALTRRSMRWMLEAAGAGTAGLAGRLRLDGLIVIWLWTLRTWQRDETADLAATMAALDAALARAERAAGWLVFSGPKEPGAGTDASAETAPPEEPAPEDNQPLPG